MNTKKEMFIAAFFDYLDEYKQEVIEQTKAEVKKMLQEAYMFPAGFVKRKQAMHILNCSRGHLWTLTKHNLIGYVGSGQQMQFSLEDIKNYLKLHHIKADALERRLKEASVL